MPPAPTRRQLQAILNTPENPPMTSQHHFYGNAPTSGSPRSYRTESNFNPKYDNFIQAGSDMPCAEYARTLPAGEEPGPRGAPPSETARTERSRRRGWRGRRAPLPPSQASRGVGHRPPLPGSRAPAPAPPTPQLRGRGGARPLRSAGTHGLPCGRAGGRPEQARRGARKGRHGAGSVWRRAAAEGPPGGRAARGKSVLPGLYLSWSPRCCRLGAPRARRHWQKPGTAPCLSLPPPLSARTAPRSGGARWRRGAEHTGRCSSPGRLPKMAAGPGGR